MWESDPSSIIDITKDKLYHMLYANSISGFDKHYKVSDIVKVSGSKFDRNNITFVITKVSRQECHLISRKNKVHLLFTRIALTIKRYYLLLKCFLNKF